jgi:hypothetical protein
MSAVEAGAQPRDAANLSVRVVSEEMKEISSKGLGEFSS